MASPPEENPVVTLDRWIFTYLPMAWIVFWLAAGTGIALGFVLKHLGY